MCQAFPPDLLRVARGVVDPDANPLTLTPNIETLLRDKGFAETHLHLGAALDFSLAWAALMGSLARSESTHKDFESPGTCFKDGRGLFCWITYAAVGRLVLAEWLFQSPPSETTQSKFLEFAQCLAPLDVIERARLASILFDLRLGRRREHQTDTPRFSGLDIAKRFVQARATYRQLKRPSSLFHAHVPKPENRTDVYATDPISQVVGWQPRDGISPETLFVQAALARIEQDEMRGEKETDFSRLFWQVIRVRCLLYRHVVQRPMTPGLQWFVRFFSRIKPLRKNLSGSLLASTAARISGQGIGLQSLEVRLGTDPSESECLELVRNLEKTAGLTDESPRFKFFRPGADDKERKTKTARFEVGGVFHFSRKRGGNWEVGKPNAFGLDHSFPGWSKSIGAKPLKDAGNPTGFRFARFYMEQRRHAQSLVSLFQKYPLALRTIRGIDLCTDEAGVPVWVMAPLVRWVREAGDQASNHLKRRSGVSIPPLRTSVHAGEDFVHLMAGLRRIDDTITHLGIREGDRLGHALALGIDAPKWCDSTGRVVQTREERLLDLVWEWNCYAKRGVDVTPKRQAYVGKEIGRLAHHIFDKKILSYAPDDVAGMWDSLHKERSLQNTGFPDQAELRRYARRGRSEESSETDAAAERMLDAYLCDELVWRKGRVLETIDLRSLKHESQALTELQKGLQRRIGNLCLTIEVNPSSNLLIGDLIDFKNHPLWRIRPVGGLSSAPPMSICIGSDNPLTFATSLPHEYQLLFDAIVLGEQSHEVAIKWIDEVRESGMRARFTLASDEAHMSEPLRVPNLLQMKRPQSPP
jgi:hypothetical protein